MTYLLDTNCCVEYLRRGDSTALGKRLESTAPADIQMCSVVVGELLYGAHRSSNPTDAVAKVWKFAFRFASLPFDDGAAELYAVTRAHLAALGTPIGPNDLMISAIALAHVLTLVTHNMGEFGRVPGLTLEDWQLP